MSVPLSATAGAHANMRLLRVTWEEVLEAVGPLDRLEVTPSFEAREPSPGSPVLITGDTDGPAGPFVFDAVTRTGRRLVVTIEGSMVAGVHLGAIDDGLQRSGRPRRRAAWIVGSATGAGFLTFAIVLVRRATRRSVDDGSGWSAEGAAWLDNLDWDDFLYLLGRQYEDTTTAQDEVTLGRLRAGYENATGYRF
jgi:hypothetical protein